MRLEWDERKQLANLTKHGLDFRRAVQVFDRQSLLICREGKAKTDG